MPRPDFEKAHRYEAARERLNAHWERTKDYRALDRGYWVLDRVDEILGYGRYRQR